ncbi:MAG: ABC transporter permease [Bacillota bacterium]|nr:ABC transporter permease [Bacillota bacterium]
MTKAFTRDKRFIVCGSFVALVLFMALFGPNLAPYDPDEMRAAHRLEPSSRQFLLGTDSFGRDTLSRLFYGARVTLFISVVSVLIGVVFGVSLGLLAGFLGGWVDTVIMRSMDAALTLPPIVLAIFVVTFVGSTLLNVTAVIAVLSIPRFARLAYGSTMSVKQNEYVEAMYALGASTLRILFRAILPNIAAPIFVQASLSLAHAILTESSLSFLGLGPPPDVASWGRMIEQSYRFMHLGAYTIIWPAVMISLTVVAFNILGDAARDLIDPRLRT